MDDEIGLHKASEAHEIKRGLFERVGRALPGEVAAFHWRMRLLNAFAFLLPHLCFNRLRTALYRAFGIRIGAHSLVLGSIQISGKERPWERLSLGAYCQITAPLYADVNAPISIGNHVAIGHHTVLITTGHVIGTAMHRCGTVRCAPVVIEDGCWLGAGVTVLPGVTIHRGSVVAAGAVVTSDVPPNTLVGGVPARRIRDLEDR